MVPIASSGLDCQLSSISSALGRSFRKELCMCRPCRLAGARRCHLQLEPIAACEGQATRAKSSSGEGYVMVAIGIAADCRASTGSTGVSSQ